MTNILPTWIEVVVGLAALATAIHTIWFKVVVPISKAVDLMTKVTPLLEEMVIHFRPNSGKSLFDHIVRIEDTVEELRDRIEQSEAHIESIHEVIYDPATDTVTDTVTFPNRRKKAQ